MPDRDRADDALAPALVGRGAALAGDDAIDWEELGPAGTRIPDPVVVRTACGLAVTVFKPRSTGPFLRLDQVVAPPGPWDGNIAAGRPLLTTNGMAGPIALAFDRPLLGGGAQIQPNRFGPFTASVAAFDARDRCLARVTRAGHSTDDADDSAIFVGVRGGAACILRIEFDVPGVDFAIDQVDLATAAGAVAAVRLFLRRAMAR